MSHHLRWKWPQGPLMIERFSRLSRRSKAALLAAVVIATAVLAGAVRWMGRTPPVPTLTIQKEEFVDSLKFRGEIKALKSMGINAPAEGGELQILKIAADGTQVKKGD